MSIFRRSSSRGLAALIAAIATAGAVSAVVAVTAFGGFLVAQAAARRPSGAVPPVPPPS